MNPHILAIFQKAHAAGPALFPPGPDILDVLRWDVYRNYYEIDTLRRYIYTITSALISVGDDVVRVKQTINLDGMGVHRKHETAFAFPLDQLAGTTVRVVRSHPGSHAIRRPQLPEARSFSPGTPSGLFLTFSTPIQVRRWSCMPFTADAVQEELSVFDISIWFTSESVARFAEENLIAARDEWLANGHESSTSKSGIVIPAPQFSEIPSAPPGGISRGY